MIILFLDVNIYQNCDIYSRSIHGVNVRLAINLTMTTRHCAPIRNYLDSSNPANWTSEELKVELEKIGIKITENLSNKHLRRIYLDNKKNSSDNVGSGAEQVDAAQTNDASVNSSGLFNIGDTETIRDNLRKY